MFCFRDILHCFEDVSMEILWSSWEIAFENDTAESYQNPVTTLVLTNDERKRMIHCKSNRVLARIDSGYYLVGGAKNGRFSKKLPWQESTGNACDKILVGFHLIALQKVSFTIYSKLKLSSLWKKLQTINNHSYLRWVYFKLWPSTFSTNLSFVPGI